MSWKYRNWEASSGSSGRIGTLSYFKLKINYIWIFTALIKSLTYDFHSSKISFHLVSPLLVFLWTSHFELSDLWGGGGCMWHGVVLKKKVIFGFKNNILLLHLLWPLFLCTLTSDSNLSCLLISVIRFSSLTCLCRCNFFSLLFFSFLLLKSNFKQQID